MGREYRITPRQHEFVIPLGSWVRITKSPGMVDHTGECAVVVGYQPYHSGDPVDCISELNLELPGDPFFKWPSCFPWQVERCDPPPEWADWQPRSLITDPPTLRIVADPDADGEEAKEADSAGPAGIDP